MAPNIGDIFLQIRDGILGLPQKLSTPHKTPNPLGRQVTFSGTVTAAEAGLTPATAFFVFDTKPQSGRLWSVRKLVAMATGAGPFAANLANVTGALFLTSSPSNNAAQPLPAMDCAVPQLTIPTSQVFGAHMVTVRGSKWLAFGVQGSGVTTGLQVFGYVDVLEIDDDADLLTVL